MDTDAQILTDTDSWLWMSEESLDEALQREPMRSQIKETLRYTSESIQEHENTQFTKEHTHLNPH